MKHKALMLLGSGIVLTLNSCSAPVKTAATVKQPAFFPKPLEDAWSKWLVGEWEGSGESQTGQGSGLERIEFTLNGQFLICRGQAKITEITPDQANYLKKNMQASDEEIERFKREGYQSLHLFTIEPTTGEVVGYLFDSLRCIATGRGKRDENREVMEWQWATGHKSTRITEKVDDDTMLVIQRTRMPDGSVMEEKGQSTRRKSPRSAEKTNGSQLPQANEQTAVRAAPDKESTLSLEKYPNPFGDPIPQ